MTRDEDEIELLCDLAGRGERDHCQDPPVVRESDAPRGVFDDELVTYARLSAHRLPITSTAGVSRQFRRALMAAADQPVAEIISGHVADGAPSQIDHLAIVPLPAVVGRHAHGELLGVALALPRDAGGAARRSVLRAVARLEQPVWTSRQGDTRAVTLLLGEAGQLTLRKLAPDESAGRTLQRHTWTRPSMRWISVTPVALDRHPGDLRACDPGRQAAALEAAQHSIAASVRRIGLPEPIEIDVLRSRVLPGIASPRAYSRYAAHAGQSPTRVLVHVRLRFAQRVYGPLLLGAGRYHGLGLCLPVDHAAHGRRGAR